MERAKSLHLAWQAAAVLKKADPAELNDYRLAAHKAFRDANPGPSSAPTPGIISPGKYNRPLITDGHSATSTGHDGPNTSPQVATSAPDAHSFDRPPLSAGHQTPSPSFMKASFEYLPRDRSRPCAARLRGDGEGTGTACPDADARAPVPPVPRGVPHEPGSPPGPARNGTPYRAAVGKSADEEVLAEPPPLPAPSARTRLTSPSRPRQEHRPLPRCDLEGPLLKGDLVDDAVYKRLQEDAQEGSARRSSPGR